MKKILFVVLTSILLCCLTACSGIEVKEEEKREDGRFVRIEKNEYFITVYDKNTKVQYAVSNGYYNAGTVTVLVDAEGKPLLYND